MYYGRTNSTVGGGSTPQMQTQAKEVKATSFPTQVIPDEGYYLTSVKVNAPDNLAAANIKKDVTIAGVTGTFEGTTTPPSLGTADIKPTAFPTVKNASDDGVDGYSTVTVQAPDNLTAENIKSGVSIAGVTGTYEGSGGGQLDDRTKFWMRGIQNGGRRYDAEKHWIPFVMLKEYWPEKLQPSEYTSEYATDPMLAMSDYCCASYELESVELPEGKGRDGITGIPSYAFAYAGQYRTINGKKEYMTMTGGASEVYAFGEHCFEHANLNDMPNVKYVYNSIRNYMFYFTTFRTCNVPEGITRIDSNGLNSVQPDDKKVTLPTTLTEISGYGAISGSYTTNITIVLKSTTPPTLSNSSGIVKNYVDQIIVPAGTLGAYQTATNWSGLADIMVEATTETTEGGA